MPGINKKILVWLSLGLLFGTGCSLEKTQAITKLNQQETQAVGWVEKGRIAGLESEVKIKLDTGAETTSINAEILEKPEEESESGGLIKFRFTNGEGITKTFELPIVRWVRIKSRTEDYIKRPVVLMKICVAGRWVEEEVNLADRDEFDYPVLIGRNMLSKSKLVVDSSATFTNNQSCSNEES